LKKTPYPALPPKRLSGDECFHRGDAPIRLDILSFWQWAASSITGNRLRGHLAEFLVAVDLGVADGVRHEWDDYDIVSLDGVKVEVKCASFIQSWEQVKPSAIQFGIAPSKTWDYEKRRRTDTTTRIADVYVFCLLTETDQQKFDPTDLDQWECYVLTTKEINEKLGAQKTLSLRRLRGLNPSVCRFGEIGPAIKQRLAINKS